MVIKRRSHRQTVVAVEFGLVSPYRPLVLVAEKSVELAQRVLCRHPPSLGAVALDVEAHVPIMPIAGPPATRPPDRPVGRP